MSSTLLAHSLILLVLAQQVTAVELRSYHRLFILEALERLYRHPVELLSIVAHRGIRHFDVDPTWLGLSLNLLLLRPSRFRDGLASLFLLSSTLLLYLQIFGWGFTRPKRCCLIDEAPVVVP